jgi:hypothetical protein
MREETLYEAEAEAEFVSELLRGAGFEAGPSKAKRRPRGLELVRWLGSTVDPVVLSACNSGRGEIRAEGVVGLARGFPLRAPPPPSCPFGASTTSPPRTATCDQKPKRPHLFMVPLKRGLNLFQFIFHLLHLYQHSTMRRRCLWRWWRGVGMVGIGVGEGSRRSGEEEAGGVSLL